MAFRGLHDADPLDPSVLLKEQNIGNYGYIGT